MVFFHTLHFGPASPSSPSSQFLSISHLRNFLLYALSLPLLSWKTTLRKLDKQQTQEDKNAIMKQKTHPKHWVRPVVLCWPATPAHGALLWSVVDPPSATTQEKNGFPFASRYQLHTVSRLGVGPHVYFPVSVLVPHLDLFISYGWMFACMHLSALLAYLVATETRTGWISCS